MYLFQYLVTFEDKHLCICITKYVSLKKDFGPLKTILSNNKTLLSNYIGPISRYGSPFVLASHRRTALLFNNSPTS